MVYDGRIFTIEHWYKVGVDVSEAPIINILQRPQAEKTPRRHFLQTKNFIISETVHDGRIITIEHWYKVGVVVSESQIINHMQRPQAEKTPWRYFRQTQILIIS